MNKLLLAAVIVIGLGVAYYFLYQYNYNEAKDTMSLVMPDMLANAQADLTSEVGKNMTYDRAIELEKSQVCVNWTDIPNEKLGAECEFVMKGGANDIKAEHEAQLDQSVEDKKQVLYEEMKVQEKIDGVLDKCKNQSINSSSVTEIIDCINFIEVYAHTILK